MAEQKAVCGGFLVGDGLKMEGKVLSAEGSSSGGIHYVECHGNNDFTTVECELTAEQVIALYESGENVVIKLYVGESPVPSFMYLNNVGSATGLEFTYFIMFPSGLDTMMLIEYDLFFKADGTIIPQTQMGSCTRIHS